MTSLSMSQPEWVMFGMRTPQGVRLIASNSLTRAELESEYPFSLGTFELPEPDHKLSATMAEFVVIDAPDYPTAFGKLFATWSPEADPAGDLGGTPRALGTGSREGSHGVPERP